MFAHLFQTPQEPQKSFYVADQGVDAWGQLTPLASTFDHVDHVFYFTMWMCVFFFVLIAAVLGWSVLKYRRVRFDQPAASNVTHNTPLEVVWTVIPLILVMIIFAWGWKGSLDMAVAPQDARNYKATAAQWSWTFRYHNDPGSSLNELWLEVDKPAAFTLESKDVLHAFFIPSMRCKRDVVPGRNQRIWFTPTRLGDYHLFCAEYCGKDHSLMYAKVHVVTAEQYGKRPWDTEDPDPKVNGQRTYEALCKSCHAVAGPNTAIAPSWFGLYGKSEAVIEGGQEKTITVDDAYLIESIRNPSAKIVKGYESAGRMSPFDQGQVSDRKLGFIIEYIKSLK
ncbi:MAG: cytochrome c oxidase subunit II [Planctomycetes bacterium]|nr:cytochrome c oxidase subunit II [Planctomycetota bacterium]